ncbi:MAG: glutathione S-transferase family protein [Betaproteobacteria bacterium]|nr:glutathione S-transferase family protein [Betaproteobacteria bacterium]
MPMKLFYAPGACSFVPHVLLEMSASSFEPVMVRLHKGEQHSDDYKRINPNGQVPVLVHDASVITQIMAITLYLDMLFPQQQFLPTAPLARAQALSCLAWMNNTVHPTFTHIFMPGKFTEQAQAQAAIRQHALAQYTGLLADLQSLVVAKNAAGQPWLAGEHCGPLDAYALTLARWGTIAAIAPEQHPTLWAFVQQVAAQPAVARVIARERLQLDISKPAA